MRKISSKLSNQELQQLAKQILNKTDQYHINLLMERMAHPSCAPDYFRQDMINFITVRSGREPDQVVEGILKKEEIRQQAERSRAKQPDGLAVIRHINFAEQGKPAAQNPNTLVAVGCTGCGIRLSVTVAELEELREAYCPKCLNKGVADNKATEAALDAFIKNVPQFYPHPDNIELLGKECERRKIAVPTVAALVEIFIEIRNQMPFKRLTDEEGRAMTSAQWEELIKKDPQAGGLNLDEVKEGQKRGAAYAWSSNSSRPTGVTI
jgi:hypothetical protein